MLSSFHFEYKIDTNGNPNFKQLATFFVELKTVVKILQRVKLPENRRDRPNKVQLEKIREDFITSLDQKTLDREIEELRLK